MIKGKSIKEISMSINNGLCTKQSNDSTTKVRRRFVSNARQGENTDN